MRRAPAAALLVLTVASLAGCGNKGPLFLPATKPAPAATAAVPAAPSSVAPAIAGTAMSPASPR